jgi:hypothetical protein
MLTVKEDPMFLHTPDDEKLGLSIEDQAFLEMTSGSCMR